jgi:hypothetical protein
MKFGERNHKGVIHRGGRPSGARTKLQSDFLRDLAEAWELEGKGALRIMVKEEPSRFVQVCASLMPKEVALEVGGPLAELSDDELLEALQAVKELRARTIELEANSDKAGEVEEEGKADACVH